MAKKIFETKLNKTEAANLQTPQMDSCPFTNGTPFQTSVDDAFHKIQFCLCWWLKAFSPGTRCIYPDSKINTIFSCVTPHHLNDLQ